MANKSKVFCSEEEMQEHFDVKIYLQAVHPPLWLKAESGVWKRHTVAHENLQDFVFKGQLSGKRLLVVGCGPSIHELTYLAPHYREFVLSDIVENSLEEIRKWKRKDPEAHNWSEHFKHYAERANAGDKWRENQELVREGIQDVVIGNLKKDDPLAPNVFEPFDAIVAAECLGALLTVENLTRALRVLSEKYLNPGGHFLIAAVWGDDHYNIGEKSFQWGMFTVKDYEKACRDAGLEIVKSITQYPGEDEDPKAWIFTQILAKKPALIL